MRCSLSQAELRGLLRSGPEYRALVAREIVYADFCGLMGDRIGYTNAPDFPRRVPGQTLLPPMPIDPGYSEGPIGLFMFDTRVGDITQEIGDRWVDDSVFDAWLFVCRAPDDPQRRRIARFATGLIGVARRCGRLTGDDTLTRARHAAGTLPVP